MDFYNTNKESGEQLKSSKGKARHQDEVILSLFTSGSLAPHQIEMRTGIMLTSVRRSLSNLTESGKLEKCDKMVNGSFGKKVHTWKLVEKQLTMF